MSVSGVNLSRKEIGWIVARRIARLTDDKEVQIYPMGAERYLSRVLSECSAARYDFKSAVVGKNILVIPGHGNSAFLLAQAGARSVTVYDKDPITIAWVKAFKKFYHYREYDSRGSGYPSVGELLSALTSWKPPLLELPQGRLLHAVVGFFQPNFLRRVYIHYMVDLVQRAVQIKSNNNYELDKPIDFHVGTLDTVLTSNTVATYDTAFIPYLLGIKNGVENSNEVGQFIDLLSLAMPKGTLIITPTRKMREFYLSGKTYFETTGYGDLMDIPMNNKLTIIEDRNWFRTQGLVALRLKEKHN